MAWGFFNKIKKGLKKAWNFAKNKVIKPIVNTAKKVTPFVAPIVDKFIPGAGTIANSVVQGVDSLVNKGDPTAIAEAIRSGKIRLK